MNNKNQLHQNDPKANKIKNIPTAEQKQISENNNDRLNQQSNQSEINKQYNQNPNNIDKNVEPNTRRTLIHNKYIVKCTECNKTTTTNYTPLQQTQFNYFCCTCSTYRIRNNLCELIQWKCDKCNKKWNTFNGYIQHFKRSKDLNDPLHQNNEVVYNMFNIKPCLNDACNKFVKLNQNINYKYNKIHKNNDGFCNDCDKVNYYENIKNDNKLGIFNNIDNIILFKPIIQDKIPNPVLDDYTSAMAKILKILSITKDESTVELYFKLKLLLPKVVLSARGGGGSKGRKAKIRIMKKRIKYFNNLDFDKILFEIGIIKREIDKYNIKINK